MSKINWSELFPTKFSGFIFISYMLLFVSQGILVTASQDKNNNYNYSTVSVVLMTEVLKLVISIVFYLKDNNTKQLVLDVINNTKLLLLYLIPAFLYCLYNNLTFINLATFDPTTYYLLLQLRVLVTGVLFQVIFKKYLSSIQWFSLILLTIGCMLKQVDFGFTSPDTSNLQKNTKGFDFSISAIFILVQTLCSCFAGVYNEHLLKNVGADVNIFIQNIFMYLDSILCNVIVLLFQGGIGQAFEPDNLSIIFHYRVAFIMISNAIVGIITSFFLKSLNSILKTIASALEILITAVMCYVLFGIPVHLNTILSITIVSYAIMLYSRNPVVNLPKSYQKHEEKENLIKEEV